MIIYDEIISMSFFFFQAEDGIRVIGVTGVQTCALPILQGGDPYSKGGEHANGTLGVLAALRVGIAALHDEVLDDAVEFRSVVESGIRQLLEIGDGVRRLLLKKLGAHRSFVGFYRCNLRHSWGNRSAVNKENNSIRGFVTLTATERVRAVSGVVPSSQFTTPGRPCAPFDAQAVAITPRR